MRSIGALALLLYLGLAGPGWADWWADATVCSDPSARPDARINACAAIIQSNETPPVNLPIAYSNRGLAHAAKGEYGFAIRDYDEALRRDPELTRAYAGRGGAHQALGEHDDAIRDFDEALRRDGEDSTSYRRRGDSYAAKHEYEEAIRNFDGAIGLDPEDAAAHLSRGNTYRAKAQYELAVRDYDEALRLDPENVTVYWHRGLARFFHGEFDAAAPDLDRAVATTRPGANGILWRYLARSRGAQRTDIAAAAANVDLETWPGPIVAMFLGRTLPAELLRAAEDPHPVRRRNQTCQAVFFIGQQLLLLGKKGDAMPLFEQVRDGCPRGSPEQAGADAELARRVN